MDFIIGLPPSRRGDKVYDAICVIVDRYTKMALYLPIVKTITITKLADLFLNKVVRRFRTPRGIISNRGSIFTNRQTERQNQTLEYYLYIFYNKKQSN
jgi:hypothetical protein